MNPRIVVCSLNLWHEKWWPERRGALQRFLARSPDVLAFQELRPATQRAIDQILTGHQRVEDENPAWSNEGNLYWRNDIFTFEEHGSEDFGAVERYSRLFWAKLRTVQDPRIPILFATAHFTAGNKPEEKKTAVNPRLSEATRCAQHLNRIAAEVERVIFMGDLNEDEHVIWRFAEEGFTDVYSALDREPVPTNDSVCLPNRIPAVDDWILFRGPVTPMTFEVARCHADPFPPSDHRPVVATFSL